MKEDDLTKRENIRFKSGLFMVPEEVLDSLVAKQDRILALLEAKKEAVLGGYVTEKQAMEQINKKVTWFWQMRKTGRLPFKRIGKTVYYKVDDITLLLENI